MGVWLVSGWLFQWVDLWCMRCKLPSPCTRDPLLSVKLAMCMDYNFGQICSTQVNDDTSEDIVGLMRDHDGSSALAQERSCWDLAWNCPNLWHMSKSQKSIHCNCCYLANVLRPLILNVYWRWLYFASLQLDCSISIALAIYIAKAMELLWSRADPLIYWSLIPMACCGTAVSPFRTQWRYCSLALSHRYVIWQMNPGCALKPR